METLFVWTSKLFGGNILLTNLLFGQLKIHIDLEKKNKTILKGQQTVKTSFIGYINVLFIDKYIFLVFIPFPYFKDGLTWQTKYSLLQYWHYWSPHP